MFQCKLQGCVIASVDIGKHRVWRRSQNRHTKRLHGIGYESYDVVKGGKRPPPFNAIALHAEGHRFEPCTAHHGASKFFVYILQSSLNGQYYIGSAEDVTLQHSPNCSRFVYYCRHQLYAFSMSPSL